MINMNEILDKKTWPVLIAMGMSCVLILMIMNDSKINFKPIVKKVEPKNQVIDIEKENTLLRKEVNELKDKIAIVGLIQNNNLCVTKNNYPKEDYLYINEDWTINEMPRRLALTPEAKKFLSKFLRVKPEVKSETSQPKIQEFKYKEKVEYDDSVKQRIYEQTLKNKADITVKQKLEIKATKSESEYQVIKQRSKD